MSEQNQLTTTRDKIDRLITSDTALSANGSLAFKSLDQIMEFAKVMAIGQVAIPKHLRDSPGACLAVAIQASEWEMSPFAVANNSYAVNDRLAYEAQLISAVILKRAPIVGRFKYSYSGEGETRRCKVSATLRNNEGDVEYESPQIGKITVKNSPLWKGDPDQQLGYFAARALCRRHFPDVILGVYSPEEMAEETMRDVTPKGPTFRQDEPKITEAPAAGKVIEMPKAEPTPEPETRPEPKAPESTKPEPTPEPKKERKAKAAPAPETPAGPSVHDILRDAMNEDDVPLYEIYKYITANSLGEPARKVPEIPAELAQRLVETWSDVRGACTQGGGE